MTEQESSFYVICDNSGKWHPDLKSALDYAAFCLEDDEVDEVRIRRAESMPL